MTLDRASNGTTLRIVSVAGTGSFRRRLLELGLLPGTFVTRLRVAPLGDPIELSVRGAGLSIRHREARDIVVQEVADVEARGAS